MTKMFFKSELKYSKGYGHVTDDVISLFLSSKKLSGKTLLRCKFSLPFVETYHRPSTVLGLVSFIPPLDFKNGKSSGYF